MFAFLPRVTWVVASLIPAAARQGQRLREVRPVRPRDLVRPGGDLVELAHHLGLVAGQLLVLEPGLGHGTGGALPAGCYLLQARRLLSRLRGRLVDFPDALRDHIQRVDVGRAGDVLLQRIAEFLRAAARGGQLVDQDAQADSHHPDAERFHRGQAEHGNARVNPEARDFLASRRDFRPEDGQPRADSRDGIPDTDQDHRDDAENGLDDPGGVGEGVPLAAGVPDGQAQLAEHRGYQAAPALEFLERHERQHHVMRQFRDPENHPRNGVNDLQQNRGEAGHIGCEVEDGVSDVAEDLPELLQVRDHFRQHRRERACLRAQVHINPRRQRRQHLIDLQACLREVHH